MRRYQKTAFPQYLFVAIALILIVGFAFLSMFIMEQVVYEDQFILPWAAGRMWLMEGINPYDSEIRVFIEEILTEPGYLGRLPESTTLNMPAINLIFYLPFSLIPFKIARALWVTSLALCTLALGYFSLRLSGWRLSQYTIFIVLLSILLWFPSAITILQGHLSPVVFLLVFSSIFLILKGQDTAAGLLLALTSGDFLSTVLIVILILLWSLSRRRWGIPIAFFAGVAFLIIISVILLPSWPLDWLRTFIQTFDRIDMLRTPLIFLANRLPGISQYLSIALHALLFIYLLTNWITLWGKTGRVFVWVTLMTLVVAYLLHVQASNAQIFLIVPALFMVFRFWADRWRLIGRILSWIVFALIIIGSWLLVYPDINFTQMPILPLINVVLPILVFIGMIWNRWWALKIPKFIFEDK